MPVNYVDDDGHAHRQAQEDLLHTRHKEDLDETLGPGYEQQQWEADQMKMASMTVCGAQCIQSEWGRCAIHVQCVCVYSCVRTALCMVVRVVLPAVEAIHVRGHTRNAMSLRVAPTVCSLSVVAGWHQGRARGHGRQGQSPEGIRLRL